MKTNYKANGIEFEINGETLFIHVDQMWADMPVSKARIDEFAGEHRHECYTRIADYLQGIVDMIQSLKAKHD